MSYSSWLYYAADTDFRNLLNRSAFLPKTSKSSETGAMDALSEVLRIVKLRGALVFQRRVFCSLVRGVAPIEPGCSAALPWRGSRDHLPLPSRWPRICAIARSGAAAIWGQATW